MERVLSAFGRAEGKRRKAAVEGVEGLGRGERGEGRRECVFRIAMESHSKREREGGRNAREIGRWFR